MLADAHDVLGAAWPSFTPGKVKDSSRSQADPLNWNRPPWSSSVMQ